MDKNMEYYELKQDLKVILYGVNKYAKELSIILKERKIQVCAYWDRRAEELGKVDEIPVYFYNNYPKNLNKEEICLIIMLQNASQHDELAMELFKNGFRKIIYIPMQKANNENAAKELRKIYNWILLKQFEDIRKIPFFETIMQDICKESNAIYEKTKDFFTINASADIVYTNPFWSTKGNKNWEKYADIPLSAYKPYVRLFDYLEGKGGILEEYLNDYGVNSCHYKHNYKNSDILEQRGKIYELWNEHFQDGMDFFISSAPLAEWNEKGYFNLLEGQHRTLFLLRKGIRYIPLRISKTDYEKWYNLDVVSKIKQERLEKFFTICPIQNPEFQRIAFYNKISIINSILYIQENLNKRTYVNKNILDISPFMGYYGMHMRRMGAKKITILNPFDKERNTIKEIGKLYGLSNIKCIKEIEFKNLKEFSMLIAIGNIGEDKHFKTRILSQFDDLNFESCLFNLSQEEKQMIEYKEQKKYRKISNIFFQGEIQDIYYRKRKS